ncbi:MAG: EVE domain-containing protein [Oligoflexia bacterium]|nr:EVE domain-containing protein [Oligoflexia bacterium]
MAHNYWLFKTEPSTYSFAQLVRDGKTNWNGVRNFQARNFLKQVAVGDQALIYHSGDDKGVVGIARVARAGYPDPDSKKPGDWVQIDLAFEASFKRPVALKEIKATPALADLPLIKQSRLSCMPVTLSDFKLLVKLGSSPALTAKK